MSISLIVTAAGESNRFRDSKRLAKKQWLRVGKKPLWQFVADRLYSYYEFDKLLVTLNKKELHYARGAYEYEFVEGGESRSISVYNALQKVTSKFVLITDAARACVPKYVLSRLIEQKDSYDCIVPYLGVSDTTFYEDRYLKRDEIKLIQTPQLCRRDKLLEALEGGEFSDESSAMYEASMSVGFVQGSCASKKLTSYHDLKELECLEPPTKEFFVGFGYDSHRFSSGEGVYLGGVFIPCGYSFLAHSDGDVLLHALIDALLGATGSGDIGELFPDSDEAYRGADSKVLLKKVVDFVIDIGYEITNIDLTVVTQKPKLKEYKEQIRASVASLLEIEKVYVNIKATTAEKMGHIGNEEGAEVKCVANLKFYNWMDK